jgi:heme exporter protein D
MNWSQFFSMGGYGFYVWGSYAAALIVLGGEVFFLRQRRNAARARHSNVSRTDSKEL